MKEKYLRMLVVIILMWIYQCFCVTTMKDWGDNCTHSDDCYDHRMICVPDINNVLKCACDRFHAWNATAEDCIQMYSAEYMLNQTVTVHDNQGENERLQKLMFLGPLYSLYFMVLVISSCVFIVLIYCIHIRAKDYRLHQAIYQLQAVNALKQTKILPQVTSRASKN